MSRTIKTEIIIEAAVEQVWRHLIHFNEYPTWNPLIRKIRGAPAIGRKLAVSISLGGAKKFKVSPTVTGIIDQRLLSWRGHLVVPGLFDGEHSFILEPISERSTRFIQEEDFSGLLVPLMFPFLEQSTRSGFETMNKALKRKSETGL